MSTTNTTSKTPNGKRSPIIYIIWFGFWTLAIGGCSVAIATPFIRGWVIHDRISEAADERERNSHFVDALELIEDIQDAFATSIEGHQDEQATTPATFATTLHTNGFALPDNLVSCGEQTPGRKLEPALTNYIANADSHAQQSVARWFKSCADFLDVIDGFAPGYTDDFATFCTTGIDLIWGTSAWNQLVVHPNTHLTTAEIVTAAREADTDPVFDEGLVDLVAVLANCKLVDIGTS